MGNHVGRQATAHKQHVIHVWNAINNNDPNQMIAVISEAWLKAAELTPTWVWALVDLPETMHSTYKQNPQFLNMIQQVRDFLHNLIKVHKCDPEMIKTLAFRLGARHRHYMNEGNDNSYWAPFAQQLPLAMVKAYMQAINNDNRIRRILRIRPRADKSEEDELIESWRLFMNMVVEAMKRGYEGCPSEKTPLRLSITNSIISMASVRSTRSRSASNFLEPTLSPALACTITPTRTPSPPNGNDANAGLHGRSRSIFRNRPIRTSQDLSAIRRLSSPMNPAALLTSSDLQLLHMTNRKESRNSNSDQHRSLSVLSFL